MARMLPEGRLQSMKNKQAQAEVVAADVPPVAKAVRDSLARNQMVVLRLMKMKRIDKVRMILMLMTMMVDSRKIPSRSHGQT